MTDSGESSSSSILKSIAAVLGGIIVAIVLSVATDAALEKAGIFPPPNQPQLYSTSLLLLATLHRTIWGILGSYIAARFAPRRPMLHALIPGFLGVAANIVGAIVMWSYGNHWYPFALTALALPSAWIGGKLRLMQLE